MQKQTKKPSKKLNLTIHQKMYNVLQTVANEKGQTVSALIRLAIFEYLSKEKPKDTSAKTDATK